MRLRGAGAILLGLALGACRGSAAPTTAQPVAPTTAAAHDDEGRPAVDPEARARAEALFARIGVVGASASAGFGGVAPMSAAFDLALTMPHSIFDVSSSAHFLRPLDIGQVQTVAVRAKQATVVLAVDFLFWFAYGVKSDATRREHLQLGMTMLEELDVPVFVGDLPDVHGASRKMISASQIPSVAMLEELNATIDAWASADPDIHLVPLAGWMTALKNEDDVALWGRPYAVRAGRLLQWDRLHPTSEGQAVLAVLLLERIAAAVDGLTEADVVVDPDAIAVALAPAESAETPDAGPVPAGLDALPPPPTD